MTALRAAGRARPLLAIGLILVLVAATTTTAPRPPGRAHPLGQNGASTARPARPGCTRRVHAHRPARAQRIAERLPRAGGGADFPLPRLRGRACWSPSRSGCARRTGGDARSAVILSYSADPTATRRRREALPDADVTGGRVEYLTGTGHSYTRVAAPTGAPVSAGDGGRRSSGDRPADRRARQRAGRLRARTDDARRLTHDIRLLRGRRS